MSDLGETLEAAVGTAIQSAVSRHEHGMATKWVAVVESIDQDGKRGVWTMTSEDLNKWESLGLLRYALLLEETP